MSDEMTADDYQKAFDDWYEKYDIQEFFEAGPVGKAAVEKLDPKLVWTQHGTCENDKITNGFSEFDGGTCGCWQGIGWWLGTVPVEGDDPFVQIDAAKSFPCPECNANGEDENIDDDCEECEGTGYAEWYCD